MPSFRYRKLRPKIGRCKALPIPMRLQVRQSPGPTTVSRARFSCSCRGEVDHRIRRHGLRPAAGAVFRLRHHHPDACPGAAIFRYVGPIVAPPPHRPRPARFFVIIIPTLAGAAIFRYGRGDRGASSSSASAPFFATLWSSCTSYHVSSRLFPNLSGSQNRIA